MVHPDLVPLDFMLCTKNIEAGIIIQKEKLFIRGKDMSGVVTNRGISQFLNLLIRKGIIKKNTITILCLVTTVL